MKWRLLLDIEAVNFLSALSRADEQRLRFRLRPIQESPDQFADFPEQDERGREVAAPSLRTLCHRLLDRFS